MNTASDVKPDISQWKTMLLYDVGFLKVYCRLYCRKFFTSSNQTSHYIRKYIRIMFLAFLQLFLFIVPQVRKAAQEGVCIVLKGSLFMLEGSAPPHHPAASMTTKHCIQLIEACGGKLKHYFCFNPFHKWDIGKQCRPRSDSTECCIWSGSTLLAYRNFCSK